MMKQNLSAQCTLQYNTTVMLERTVQIKCPGPQTKQGRMNSEEPHDNLADSTPLWQALGPLWDGEGQSRQAVRGNKGAKDWWLPPWK